MLNLRRLTCLGLLVLLLTGCAGTISDFKTAAIEAGKEIASEAGPIIAEKATKAGADAFAAKVANDDQLAPEEKDKILSTLYDNGLTIASLLAALRMWALARGRNAALGVVVKGVDKLPPEIAEQVKSMVASMGGSAPAIKKTITAAKS